MTNQRGQKLVGLVNTLFLFFSSFTSHSYSYTHTCQGTAQHKLIFTDIIHNISAFKCLKTVTHLLYILNDVLALSQMQAHHKSRAIINIPSQTTCSNIRHTKTNNIRA